MKHLRMETLVSVKKAYAVLGTVGNAAVFHVKPTIFVIGDLITPITIITISIKK